MESTILDVDLLAFEQGDARSRRAVLDGVRRSLATGFVYTSSDLSTDLLDTAYGMLERFFALDGDTKGRFRAVGASGQTGYTGLLVETAAGSERADWKEMLNWAAPIPAAHPLRRRYPLLYPDPLLPEAVVPGISEVLQRFHRALADLQRRFLRVVALGLGAAESFFEEMVSEAPTLSRAIRYPPMAAAPGPGHLWAAAHGDINLITALPRATGAGLEVEVAGGWVPALPPEGRVIINSGLMLERLSNGLIPAGLHRVVAPPDSAEERLSVVQFCHARPSTLLAPLASCCTPDNPQRLAGVLAADALEDVLYRINLL
ncbi:isopenicillin N synthase family oxygenase [Synechococcus sp. BSF8S]|uniref:isopenicillin N synthase family dioxygenase n=1 Tax=Synechococcales TaxID=1890424 RepID=UPI001627E230|nr:MULTISPECIES: isopenicillin N synthase family oxygenase [unclassified Synechococcus]MBC1260773.1 isopenicillin N synthase family oxygenase [Synechococcus sp. BSF8S]MBC1263449.1 isopenicillin N synthase family oxygenase [Synechococcus sp. BSA11S]